jgi:flagellin
MPSILSTNMASLYAQRNLASAQAELAGSVQKLSSGRQINSAKDNAAGLGISEGVASIRNISDQSIRNLQNATSLVQTADGALDVVGKMLQRVLTLTTQKTDAVLNAAQTASIDTEITALTDEITRIKNRTTYNDTASVFSRTYTFGSGAGVTKDIVIPDLTGASLGLQNAGLSPINATLLAGELASSFNIVGHNFNDGDVIQYQNLGGADIGGLESGKYYTVYSLTPDSFQLKDADGNLVTISSLGEFNNDYFLKLPPPNTAVSAITGATPGVTDVIQIGRTWDISKLVIFDQKSNTNDVGEFENGGLYEVASSLNNTITLRPAGLGVGGDTVEFNINSNLDGTELNRLNNSSSINVISNLDVANSINVAGIYSNLVNGQLIYLEDPNNAVDGIDTGVYSIIKGGTIPDGYIQLALVTDRTSPISFSVSETATNTDEIEFYYATGAGNIATLSSTSLPTLSAIQTSPQEPFDGLAEDDIVIYRQGDNFVITGLIDNEPYTVSSIENDRITLIDKNGARVIIGEDIPADLSNKTFEVVEKVTFDATRSSVVTLQDSVLTTADGTAHNFSTGDALSYSKIAGTGVTGLTGLDDLGQTTFYAVVTSPSQFKLSISRDQALAGNVIALGTDNGGSIFTKNSTITTLSVMEAIATNASNRASLGAQLNVLDYAIDNLQTLSNNLSEAYSRIVDTDYAAETSALTRNQILQQAATSMLAQANQMPNVILTLLK